MRQIRIFLFCLVVSGIAFSQESRADLFAGYSYLNIDTNGLSSRQSANGWEAGVSGNFNKWLAVEGDVSGYYETYSINLSDLGLGTLDVKVTDYSFAGGPRINLRPIFIHALFGGDHLTGSAFGFSQSQDSFAGLVGGGVQWKVRGPLSVRASADYVFTRHNIFGGPAVTQNNYRAGVGIVYSFGGKHASESTASVTQANAEPMSANPTPRAKSTNAEPGRVTARAAPSSRISTAALPRAEIFGGYSYLNIDTNGLTSRKNIPYGANLSFVGNVTPWIGAETNAAAYYKKILGVDVYDYSLVFGPRVHYKWAFFHLMFGMEDLVGKDNFSTSQYSQSSPAGAIGGGGIFKLSRHIGIEGSADYVLSHHSIIVGGPGVVQNNFRTALGIVFTLGTTGSRPCQSEREKHPCQRPHLRRARQAPA